MSWSAITDRASKTDVPGATAQILRAFDSNTEPIVS